ncbi:MAG TPA: serine hydrolase domain-containing protein [Chthoniobacteraceae bacterium]|nr:serine hydrolase domain-containing protein [Chthoniobacteraceae bacterium]
MNLDGRLTRVEAFFHENFETRGELGASVSIWHEGREVLSLGAGFTDRKRTTPWTTETAVLVWSATKGPAAASVLHALERQGETLATPVRAIWPEFADAGKEALNVGDLLGHRAGVAALDVPVDALDYDAVVSALAAQPPNWPPGEGHGYHPRTFGFLLDELVRRLEGMPLGAYWRQWFATPLGLDFRIGLPPEEGQNVAPVQAARVPAGGAAPVEGEDVAFFEAMAQPGSLTARAFRSPEGAQGVAAMNTPELRAAGFPGFGGIGTARGLARFYALLAEGGALEGLRLFERQPWYDHEPITREDRILLRPTAFEAGFMRDPLGPDGRKLRQLFGPSPRAFGQPGAGGSHAFADPQNRLAFAYVMNQMERGVLPGEKALGLVHALYDEP